MATSALDNAEEQISDIIHNLYALMIQNHTYYGPQTANAMVVEVDQSLLSKKLVSNLNALTKTSCTLTVAIPHDVITFVENGRNPDVYTRQFIETVQALNQKLKGKSAAFEKFRDALAREISGAMPEVEEEVRRVVEQTGGKLP